MGLDLLQQVLRRVVAAGAAVDQQARIAPGQRQFGDIAGATPADHRAVPGHTRRRWARGTRQRKAAKRCAVRSRGSDTNGSGICIDRCGDIFR